MGSVCDAIPDASVCEYDDPVRIHTVHPITLPEVSIKSAVLLHDHTPGPVWKLLHEEAWREEKELAQKETALMANILREREREIRREIKVCNSPTENFQMAGHTTLL